MGEEVERGGGGPVTRKNKGRGMSTKAVQSAPLTDSI